MSVYEGHGVTLHHADCLDVLRTLPDASVDSVVTDPPYGLEFMGKDWDAPWRGDVSDVNADAGFNGGGISATRRAPSFTGSTNPKCQRCKGTRRGRRDGTAKVPVCLCDDGGKFPNVRAVEMRAFQEWCRLWATECLRVLKPGGHLLAFGGTRTWHRLACAVEDAGFEVRDSIAWLYGSGFPKSLDVSKAIDKRRDWTALPLLQAKVREARKGLGISQSEAARRVGLIGPDESLGGGGFMWFETGMRVPTREQYPRLKAALGLDDECDRAFEEAEREVIGTKFAGIATPGDMDRHTVGGSRAVEVDITAPATDAAREWAGWGTALKPAFEPVVVARKPLVGTVAANVLTHGTGALNIDGCRIPTDEDRSRPPRTPNAILGGGKGTNLTASESNPAGRWPANVVLDGPQAEALDEQSGESRDGTAVKRNRSEDGRAPYEASSYMITDRSREDQTYGGQGGASRFFYVAKADASERPRVNGTAHPTVKPLDLMRWLVRLVTPPGGTVLEPFAGSGTTVEACIVEGFQCIAIEKGEEYLPLIMQRIRRRRDPVAAIRQTGDELGLFELDGEGA